jgi:hypothetical protein
MADKVYRFISAYDKKRNVLVVKYYSCLLQGIKIKFQKNSIAENVCKEINCSCKFCKANSNFNTEFCQVFEQSKINKSIMQSVIDINTIDIDMNYILRFRYNFLLPFKEHVDQNVVTVQDFEGPPQDGKPDMLKKNYLFI